MTSGLETERALHKFVIYLPAKTLTHLLTVPDPHGAKHDSSSNSDRSRILTDIFSRRPPGATDNDEDDADVNCSSDFSLFVTPSAHECMNSSLQCNPSVTMDKIATVTQPNSPGTQCACNIFVTFEKSKNLLITKHAHHLVKIQLS